MAILYWLFKSLDKRKRLKGYVIETILRSDLDPKEITIVDKEYRLFSKGEVQALSIISLEWFNLYVDDSYDCDDFADALKVYLKKKLIGCPVGIIHVEYIGVIGEANKGEGKIKGKIAHALNVFVDKNESVWLLEPQDNKVFKKPQDWEVRKILI